MADETKRKVLDMVEQGQISPDEGLRLMNALEGTGKQTNDTSSQQGEVSYIPTEDDTPSPQSIPAEEMAHIKRMKRFWMVPFILGLIITLMGAIWMYSGYQANGFGWGFWLAWLPFLIGITVVAVSFPSSKSIWLHVRITQKPGEMPQRINISLPLPLRLVKWASITFGDKIPGLEGQSVGDISNIFETLSPENPFYVHVEEDGENVEVFIG